MRSLLFVFAVSALFLGSVCVYGQTDRIVDLPGLPPIIFNQYSGYININQATGRNLFYWLTESQQDPSSAPFVLWLNGGPGCSSLLGLFTELGPFYPNSDGETLSLNPYSWNAFANILFLESPSGVGFSFSTNLGDYTVGDSRTANDTYTFLQAFLVKYPQYQKSPFYITGESYAGHYIPNLAQRIVEGNNAGTGLKINFQGFFLGNPWTTAALDNLGTVEYWFSHALISEATFIGLNTTCDWSTIGGAQSQADPVACDNYQNQAFDEMGNINPYNIYVDVCYDEQGQQLVNSWRKSSVPLNNLSFEDKKRSREQDPCIEDYLTSYLNQPSVQKAIHANATNWILCSNSLNYSDADVIASMLPVYSFLLKSNVKIWIYSGDVDSVVPVTGTRLWLDALDLPIVQSWAPWTDSNEQVGGYITEYQGLTFITVRNAGHEVPAYQPLRALDLFYEFLFGG